MKVKDFSIPNIPYVKYVQYIYFKKITKISFSFSFIESDLSDKVKVLDP
jgi:hypothetical protein